MTHLSFPNESAAYREARNALPAKEACRGNGSRTVRSTSALDDARCLSYPRPVLFNA